MSKLSEAIRMALIQQNGFVLSTGGIYMGSARSVNVEVIEEAIAATGLAIFPAGVVEDFINERRQLITALENCSPDNTADYWRWQGHAESRRHLAERLAAANTAEAVSK